MNRAWVLIAFSMIAGSASAGILQCPQDIHGDQYVRNCDHEPNRGEGVNNRSRPGVNNDVPGAPDTPGIDQTPPGGDPIAGGGGGAGGGCVGCGVNPTDGGGGGGGGGCTSNCGPGDPPGKHKKNNGFGNGDDDAPGNSEFHNRAENKGGNHDGTAEHGAHGHNSH